MRAFKSIYICRLYEFLFNLQNHPTFQSEERLVNLESGRECFIGLSILLVVYGTDLADGDAVLVLSPADIEWVVVLVEAALDRPRGDVAVAGRHPGQVAVLRSHQDLYSHGMRINTEGKANCRRCFLGEMAAQCFY